MKRKKNNKKGALALLVACSLTVGASANVLASPPSVSTDEAVYINLDAYGAIDSASIVKGCSLNGVREFTDYGAYEKVSNMTNHTAPELTPEGVKWTLPQDAKERFYYECTPKGSGIQMPWQFDVSYKLNGVPSKAEELAGKAGLVEIAIACIPQDTAPTYYKNNMLLQVAAMVNMQDTLSVEAPGAQLQSVGTYKAVVFAALPGEHITFTLRIGTENFSFSGLMMLMIPGTLSQMEQIKSLKEAKDTLGDSAEDIYQSLNSVLGILDSSMAGMRTVQSGLYGLQQNRIDLRDTRENSYQSVDQMLEALTALSEQIGDMIPHMKQGKELVQELNGEINTAVAAADSLRKQIGAYQTLIMRLQQDAEAMQSVLGQTIESKEERTALRSAVLKDLDELENRLDGLETAIENLSLSFNAMRRANDRLHDQVDSIDSPQLDLPWDRPGGDGLLSKLLQKLYDDADKTAEQVQKEIDRAVAEINFLLRALRNELDALTGLLADSSALMKELNKVCAQGHNAIGDMRSAITLMDTYFDLADQGLDAAQGLLEGANGLGEQLKWTLSSLNQTGEDVKKLNDTANAYYDGVLSLLDDTSSLTGSLENALSSSVSCLSTLEEGLKANAPGLSDSTGEMVDGLIDVLEKGLASADTASKMKKANQTVKTTVEDQVSKYEDENHLLELDTEETLPSFTSDKNPTPESIQIILRTEEITKDQAEDGIQDLDPDQAAQSIWSRIASVFQRIWQSIVGLLCG